MRQAISGRTNLFSPFFQAIAQRALQAAQAGRSVENPIYAVSPERQGAAIITARGQRFSIHQIGSMFGSE